MRCCERRKGILRADTELKSAHWAGRGSFGRKQQMSRSWARKASIMVEQREQEDARVAGAQAERRRPPLG